MGKKSEDRHSNATTTTTMTKTSETSCQRFANSFPSNFPCDCQLCRNISLQCSFVHQRVRSKPLPKRIQPQEKPETREQEPVFSTPTKTLLDVHQVQSLTNLSSNASNQSFNNHRSKGKRNYQAMSLGKGVTLNEPDDRDWRTRLSEDKEYCRTIEAVDRKIEEGKKTEAEMRRMKNEREFTKHLGLVKEYRKWSNEVYAPKTNKIYEKSDAYGEKGNYHLASGYAGYLKYDSKVRHHGGYPYDRVYLDRWDQEQYDPWGVAKESLAQTTAFSGSLDPLGLQYRCFLDEAKGLFLLENGSKTEGTPPLRAMKAWLRMPYSYYAWQNNAKWSNHWEGGEARLPEVPSVCASEEEEKEEEEKRE